MINHIMKTLQSFRTRQLHKKKLFAEPRKRPKKDISYLMLVETDRLLP